MPYRLFLLRNHVYLLIVISYFQGSSAQAAQITSEAVPAQPKLNYEESLSAGGLKLFAISIQPNGSIYDTFAFDAVAEDGARFNHLENINSEYNFSPGNDDTDILGTTTIDAGFTVFQSVALDNDTPTLFEATISTFGGPPTQTLVEPFAQLVAAPGLQGRFNLRVRFAKAGIAFPEDTTLAISIVPEPSSLFLTAAALLFAYPIVSAISSKSRIP